MADTFIVIGTGPAVNVVLGGAGASAYQIWLDAGNTGTEQDFLDSLEGPQGPAGATGATGATGPQGPPGDDAPVQTLSIDGNDLTLSGGGGTVAIPGGARDALGTGFTAGGGTGTIPDATTAILDGGFIIAHSAGYILFDGTGVGEGVRAAFGPNGIIYTQDSENYLFDFNPADGYIEFRSPGGSLVLNPASSTLTGVGVQPISYTNASAPNNTIFYSATDSKLSYKDPAGVVHNLY